MKTKFRVLLAASAFSVSLALLLAALALPGALRAGQTGNLPGWGHCLVDGSGRLTGYCLINPLGPCMTTGRVSVLWGRKQYARERQLAASTACVGRPLRLMLVGLVAVDWKCSGPRTWRQLLKPWTVAKPLPWRAKLPPPGSAHGAT
jgi:hypothetical protein